MFDALLAASGARHFEVQSNDTLLAVMLHTYGRDIISEKIVFRDQGATTIKLAGASLSLLTPRAEVHSAIENCQGGGEWQLTLDGKAVARGGVLFHYNRPYGDIYMEVDPPYRRRGIGSYLVQELKRECYGFGAVPCARCDPANLASLKTLQRAGFVPHAHILLASIADPALPAAP